MSKECWQLRHPEIQTDCFDFAGSTPCSALDCAVEQKIKELKLKGDEVDYFGEGLLSHTACRLSFESVDNQEYLERTGQAGPIKYVKALFKIMAIRRSLPR